MGTYRITDSNGAEVEAFEARHTGEAILHANEVDQRSGLTGIKLWIKQHDGTWLAV